MATRMKVTFRPVRLSDYWAMARWGAAKPGYAAQKKIVEGWLRTKQDTTRIAMLYRGKVIGVGNLERHIPFPMVGWFVDPKLRGMGFGRKLASEMLRGARANKIGALLAAITPTNVASLRLALSLGFTISGYEADMESGHAVVRLFIKL